MTPDEIRKQSVDGASQWPREYETIFHMFGELTAQLAEMNQKLNIIADSMYAEGMAKYGG